MEGDKDKKRFMPTKSITFSEMFDSKVLADTTVICSGGEEISAHIIILHGCSAYFQASFRSNMQESEKRRIHLGNTSTEPWLNNDVTVINSMLEFMYRDKYTEESEADQVEKSMLLQIDLAIAADFYGVGGLYDYALKRFVKMLQDWDLLEPEFPHVVTAIYSKPDNVVEPFKAEMIKIVAANYKKLRDDQFFQSYMKKLDGFTLDLLNNISSEVLVGRGPWVTTCPRCRAPLYLPLPMTRLSGSCPSCFYYVDAWPRSLKDSTG